MLKMLTEEFVTDYLFKGVKAGAIYEGKYLLRNFFCKTLIAKKLVEIAMKKEQNIFVMDVQVKEMIK